MGRSATAEREFWGEVLLAGGLSTLPRWSSGPTSAVVEHEVVLGPRLVTGLRSVAAASAAPLSSVLLAGHARVLAALCGTDEVVTGYLAVGAEGPLPCRLHTGATTWAGLVAEAHRAETGVLTHRAYPVDSLRRELGVHGPLFESIFDPTGADGELPDGVVLWVGVAERAGRLVLRQRCRGESFDTHAGARVTGHHLRALELIVAGWSAHTDAPRETA